MSRWIPVAVLIGVLIGVIPVEAAEPNIMTPRVSQEEREAARALKNPLPDTPEVVAKGKTLYEGKGGCATCHGLTGRGDGIGAASLDPSPRNFHRPGFWHHRTEGELFWIVKHGSPGTGMIAFESYLEDDEIWAILRYERSFAHDRRGGRGRMGSPEEGMGDMRREMRPHDGGCCRSGEGPKEKGDE